MKRKKHSGVESAIVSYQTMKITISIIFVALVAIESLFEHATKAAESLQATKSKTIPVASQKNVALGLNHFAAHCASCHAKSGKADNEKGKSVGAADLTSREIQSKSDTELTRIIRNGIKGTAMPAFAKTHNLTEVKQIISFLRKLPTITDEERKQLENAVPADARHKHDVGDHNNQGQGKKSAEDQHHDHATTTTKPEQKTTSEPKTDKEAQAVYVCPMHPEVQSNKPGKCPKCGMTLEKKKAGTEEHDHANMQQAAPTTKEQKSAEQHDHSRMQQQSLALPTAQGPSITLIELEQMAVKNNPTFAQADAAIRAAEGRRVQAGLFPNPVIGYAGEELAFRAFSDKSEHFFFIEQEIPLGGKLSKSRRIVEKEQIQTNAEAEAQRLRVLNTVRTLYYEALGAQQQVDIRAELAKLTREAVTVTEELMNVGQADQPDQLEIEVESQKAELELVKAENELAQVWQVLASVIGNPSLEPMRLAGDLESAMPTIEREATIAFILQESPEMKVAKAKLERARATLDRARAERVPDMIVRGGLGYSTEKLELGNAPFPKRTGPEATIEIGFRVPIFNRNQGNISSAQAEIASSESEVKRVELSLRARLASAFMNYQNAARMVERYQTAILPRAQKSFELYTASFAQMAAAYPQVLIAKRSYYQARAEYVDALVRLWRNGLNIQGFLLSGGLSAPGRSEGETEINSGSQGNK
jgi:cobalt-zinc-cadmium efflux system outer membrane protein